MMTSNNALVPDPDKQDDLASQWWQWPILNVGLRMCSWDDAIVKYFLLGNPLVYWGSTAGLGVFAALVTWYLIRWQRGYKELTQSEIDHIHYGAVYPVIGWYGLQEIFLHWYEPGTKTSVSASGLSNWPKSIFLHQAKLTRKRILHYLPFMVMARCDFQDISFLSLG